MIGTMIVLAGVCVGIGVVPMIVVLPLGHAAAAWSGDPTMAHRMTAALPWQYLTEVSVAFLAALLVLSLLMRYLPRHCPARRAPTWTCAYIRPDSRMQYTAASFAQMLVGLFQWVLRPVTHGQMQQQLFVQSVNRHTEVPDFMTDRAGFSAWRQVKQWLKPIRRMQQGSVQQYLLYMLLALFLLLASLIPFGTILKHVMGK